MAFGQSAPVAEEEGVPPGGDSNRLVEQKKSLVVASRGDNRVTCRRSLASWDLPESLLDPRGDFGGYAKMWSSGTFDTLLSPTGISATFDSRKERARLT